MSARRVISGIFLSLALLLLILGLTIFSKNLAGQTFILYWSTCFLLTGIAAILAVIDLSIIRRKLRKEQNDLIQSTLDDAQGEKRRKSF